MKITPCLLALILAVGNASAGEIREFKLATLEKLGNELSRRDEIAARAEDLTLENYPEAKSLLAGWITELRPDRDLVYILMRKDEKPAVAYVVTFPHKGKPVVADHRGEPLPAIIALRFKARQTAITALDGKFYEGANYNFEVLDDPDGKGFLVYGLASTSKPDEQITGGHFRVTVSSDGSKAEKIDALSRGIIVGKTYEGPKGSTTVGLGTTNLVSNVPVETFLYSSHLYKMPIYVGTPDNSTWRVVNGQIHKFTKAEIAEMEAAKARGN